MMHAHPLAIMQAVVMVGDSLVVTLTVYSHLMSTILYGTNLDCSKDTLVLLFSALGKTV